MGALGSVSGLRVCCRGYAAYLALFCAPVKAGLRYTKIVKVKSVLKEESWKLSACVTWGIHAQFPLQVVPYELLLLSPNQTGFGGT